MDNNLAVYTEERGYPEPKGIAVLLGVYATRVEANFIKAKMTSKVPLGNIVIEPTDAPITADIFNYVRKISN